MTFQDYCTQLLQTYRRKNADYGDSFAQTIRRYGPIAALVRIADKFHRLDHLLASDATAAVADESVEDTLLDLAAYCILTAMTLKNPLTTNQNPLTTNQNPLTNYDLH